MKKIVLILSLALCTAFLDSCSKDQDRTSNTGNSSNSSGPAEDPAFSGSQQDNASGNASESPQDHTSTQQENQATDSTTENQTTPSGRDGNALPNSNRTTTGKDSLTGVAGQQGAGSGVGNGGSINAAQDAKKKK